MNDEQKRLQDPTWKNWGPYVSARQWGTVREDYSDDGQAWTYCTHDMARSKAYRWGEEGIGGYCDKDQLLCLSLVLWNGHDPILKEILFGLSNKEGNHGEDVKELYYYLDGVPTHAYMKMLYKYPQALFPYDRLRKENAARTRQDPEFELIDTGIFDHDEYFDVFLEYAKASPEDLLMQITVFNRGPRDAPLTVLPTAWFRNTWAWGYDPYKPHFQQDGTRVELHHEELGGKRYLYIDQPAEWLFCDNETNNRRLFQFEDHNTFTKDGINDYVTQGLPTVNPEKKGTKVAPLVRLNIPAGQKATVRLRMTAEDVSNPFKDSDEVLDKRRAETDAFYKDLQSDLHDDDQRLIQRQALAGMLWCKQFYYYDVRQWLDGDPAQPSPPPARKKGRNMYWPHVKAYHIFSMPDNWEYPWFAAWDLAFHAVTFMMLDPDFAKNQLYTLTREWFQHPNGQLPAYEWNFSDANPPVHAFAVWKVYQIEAKQNNGKGDTVFLEKLFHKLLINFTWWVNRKDAEGNNIFEGGFLGLDNVGVFDRDMALPEGQIVEQADGTAWMGMFCLNMLRISLELSRANPAYLEMANKFFAHFLYIAAALESLGDHDGGLWDEEDQFYYDQIRATDGSSKRLKLRSAVGMIPLLAVEVLDDKLLRQLPGFQKRMDWFLKNRPDLASLVSRYNEKGDNEKRLLGLVRAHRMKAVLEKMLDESEFLSPGGLRSVSKYHLQHPYQFALDGQTLTVKYLPAESDSTLFGGNSNWRGPVWMPLNALMLEALVRYHYYYGESFTIECPTGSGKFLNLYQVQEFLSARLVTLFLRDASGRRAVFGENEKLQKDPHFRDYLTFNEYFNGDNGKGLGASHQTGWTGIIAMIIQPRPRHDKDDTKPAKITAS